MRTIFKSYSLFALILLLIPILAAAGQLEDGSAALEKKQYKKAHALLLPLAKKGNVFAQYNVAVMYAKGLGVTKNDVEAVKWYKKAAEQGDANAQANLGLMYENGRGVKQDYNKAMTWYQKSAKQGNAIAQNNIGGLYFSGSGVKKDVNKGLEWVMKAAKQGLPDAQKNVFSLYYEDAKLGNPGSMHNVAYMCFNGWIGKQDPKKCLLWYEKAGENGFEPSKKALAEIYEQGLFGISKNKKKARYWTKQMKSKGK